MQRLLTLLALIAFGYAATLGAAQTQIILDQASAEIFPEAWRGGKTNAQAQLLADTQVARFRGLAERAFEKYPPALLSTTLKHLYGLGHLEFSGVATGGTRSEDSIYIVCKAQENYTDEAVERIIHAEYSSILFMEFSKHFDEKAWLAQNAEGSRYLGSGVAAVKAGKTGKELKPELAEQGYLSEYAQASIEEDFNSHVTRLFMGEDTYWQALENYPRLKAKAALVIAFYQKMDASFTPATFTGIWKRALKLSLGSIFTDKTFEEEKMETFQWSKLGAYYFTLDKPAEGKEGKDLVKQDAATGQRTVLVTAKAFTPEGEKKKPLSISSFQFSKDEKQLLLFTNTRKVWRDNTRGDYWLLDLATKKLRQLGGDAAAASLMFAKFSPDASRVAYVCKNDLYVQSLADLKVTRLTTEGSETLIHGTSDWVNEEELDMRDCFRWSPDGKHLLLWQFDTKGVPKFWMMNQTDSLVQDFTTFPYPTAGARNSATRLGVISSSGGVVLWLAIPGDPREHYLPHAEWTPDGKAVMLMQFNRLQNTLRVMSADPNTAAVREIFTETDKAWVENKNSFRWIGKEGDFLWLSERSGWRHAYRASREGKLAPITQGEWDVVEVLALPEKGSTLDYSASPKNGTQRYLYRVELSGGETKKLSPQEQAGTHSYSISEDAKWAVHTYSNFTTPPVVQLVSLPDHKTQRVLKEQSKLKEKLAALTLPKVEMIRVPIGDGLELDGWMISTAGTKRPLLMNVYGEPAAQTVRDSWGGQKLLWHMLLAQQGYVIASVDMRGTPSPRGRDWRKAVYRQLGILNSKEQMLAVKAILKQTPELDPQRVGIWGWSGGGSSSLDALFRYPEVYSMAIAVAPVADRALYDSIYEERYMGLPKDNDVGYKQGSPITHAAKLKGDLLIIHGTGDDNVHYRGTEKLLNELIALNKPFTVMPYPNRDHAINTGKGITRHLYETMTRYLQEHLLQANTPSTP